MDDIATHWKKLVRPYERSSSAQAVIESAKALAKAIAARTDILEVHRIKVLKLVQWFVTEVDGKHTTRFRSKAVYDLAMNDRTSRTKINHEHVYARQDIAVKMIQNPDQIDDLLDQVLGCIVTADEHSLLPKTDSGWGRYAEAGIVVLDMSKTPPIPAQFT